jgi:4'-phosphopantetheinyl transferase
LSGVFDLVSQGGQVADSTALTGAEVHAWHGCVDFSNGVPEQPQGPDLAILSASERERCQRFFRQADRVRFAAMHAAQRRLLACYLEVDPAEIRFGRIPCCECGSTEHGPPRIDWPPTDISCNLSGSADHWLLAVTRERRVGADIEVPRAIDTGQLASACLTASEQEFLRDQREAARLRVFYRCWTRKEAVLKACGIGLPGSMRGLDVAPGRDGPVEVRHRCKVGPDAWIVADLTAGPDPAAEPARAAGPDAAGMPDPAGTPAWLGEMAGTGRPEGDRSHG